MSLLVAGAFKKIVADKNAAAQEKGLEALLIWIDRAEDPTRYLYSLLILFAHVHISFKNCLV